MDGECGPGKLCAECEISTQERPAGKEEGGNFSLLSRRDWTIPQGAPVPRPVAIRPWKQWTSRNPISQNLTLGKERADA